MHKQLREEEMGVQNEGQCCWDCAQSFVPYVWILRNSSLFGHVCTKFLGFHRTLAGCSFSHARQTIAVKDYEALCGLLRPLARQEHKAAQFDVWYFIDPNSITGPKNFRFNREIAPLFAVELPNLKHTMLLRSAMEFVRSSALAFSCLN